jgi:DNA topoisomerase VI subunit B
MEMEKVVAAEELAKDMREISVAEFFERNKHFLGYENPTKSLVTVVKEAVDNSIEFACEAGILPKIKVKVKQLSENRFRVSIEDNGPGVVPEKVPMAFAKVLYGSRFHVLKQSRSLFGIGIKGACLYSQLTTGKPIKVTTGIGKGPIHHFELMIDVAKNEPKIISHTTEENPKNWHGVKVEMEVEGRYISGGHSILNYLKQTAMVNPFATIIFEGPDGKVVFERATNKLPPKAKEIKPHPHGVELGILRRMLSTTSAKTLLTFLTTEFSRVGKKSALENGGKLPLENVLIFRFANKVPLFYHQSDCATTEAIKEVDWRRYGISQSQGQLPAGPLAILVHLASVWVPFTSEGKQAIAAYPEILKEIKLALQDAGRKLAKYIRKKAKLRESMLRRQIFERYLPVVAECVGELTNKKAEEILNKLKNMVKSGMDESNREA